MKRVLMHCEEVIGLLFIGVETWSTGFKVAECETEWRNTSLHTVRKRVSLCNGIITRNRYVQINTGITEKVIAETLGHK